MFKELTRDASASCSLSEKEIDTRFKFALISEEADIVVDLRRQISEKEGDTFRKFFIATENYLKEKVGIACQDRRHGEQLYLAKAISINDLHRRVADMVGEDVKIPSVKWLRYQFQPLNPRANTAKYYNGQMNIKMMVQKRQVNTLVEKHHLR